MSDEATLRTLSFEHLEQLAADGGLEGTSDADWSAALADFALRHDGHLTAFSEAYGAERKAFLIGALAGRLQAQQSAAERERWSEPTTAAAFAALRIMSREGSADEALRTAAVVTLCASVGGLGADGLPPSGWGDAPSEAIRLLVNLLVLDNKRTLSALKDLGTAIPALVAAIAAPDEMAMPLEQLRLYTQCAFHASLSPSDAALDVGAALASAVAGLDWSVSRLSDGGGGSGSGGGGSLQEVRLVNDQVRLARASSHLPRSSPPHRVPPATSQVRVAFNLLRAGGGAAADNADGTAGGASLSPEQSSLVASLRKLLKVDGSALVLTPDGSYKSAHAEGMLEMKRNALQVPPPPPPPPRNSSAQFVGARAG